MRKSWSPTMSRRVAPIAGGPEQLSALEIAVYLGQKWLITLALWRGFTAASGSVRGRKA